jgi:hypothetical protein
MKLLDKADFSVIYQAERASDKDLFKEFNLTEDEYIRLASRYPSVGFEIDNKCVGGLFIRQDKIHLSVLPEYHGKWGFLFTPAFKWAFSVTDPLKAVVNVNNDKVIRFIERHDWTLIDQQGSTLIYLLTDQTTRYPNEFCT